jgi:hypothetical protein
MEILPLGTALIYVYRRTEGQTYRQGNMTKELAAFRDYVNMHKNMLKDCKYAA